MSSLWWHHNNRRWIIPKNLFQYSHFVWPLSNLMYLSKEVLIHKNIYPTTTKIHLGSDIISLHLFVSLHVTAVVCSHLNALCISTSISCDNLFSFLFTFLLIWKLMNCPFLSSCQWQFFHCQLPWTICSEQQCISEERCHWQLGYFLFHLTVFECFRWLRIYFATVQFDGDTNLPSTV